MEENKKLTDPQNEAANGGTGFPSEDTGYPYGPVTVMCPYCGSGNTYVQAFKVVNGRQIKVFHCAACNRSFDEKNNSPVPQLITD